MLFVEEIVGVEIEAKCYGYFQIALDNTEINLIHPKNTNVFMEQSINSLVCMEAMP